MFVALFSAVTHRVLMNPEDFIRYVGADNRIVDPIMEDPCGLNRSRVSIRLSENMEFRKRDLPISLKIYP